MTENNHTLTLNLDSNKLMYISKVLNLLENPFLYESGKETLDSIENQLNSLKKAKISDLETSDYQSPIFSSYSPGNRI